MWHSACDKTIVKHPECGCGWELSDRSYSLVWFVGAQMPDSVIPGPADYGSTDISDSDSEDSDIDSDVDSD